MNGQVNYIINASLLLVVATGSFLLLQNITSPLISSNQEPGSATIIDYSTAELPLKAQQGKTLFMSKCASCHVLNKDMTGPGLKGFEDRGPWSDQQKLYDWIKNPSVFMQKDDYTKGLKKQYGSMMQAFPGITNEEIDAIVEYIKQ